MSKLSKVIISLVLVALMISIQPLTILASAQETYISEVVIETGKTSAEAKKKLTDQGYLVYNKNISNTSNSNSTYGYMYIGYKTTTKAEDAITDIRVMNMGGGYSYAEYEQLLSQKAADIGARIDEAVVAINEYRQNYKNQNKAALFAYQMLNKLKEDDSGKLMGDYLLDETKTRDDYIQLFMQVSTVVYMTILKALAIACSGTNPGNLLALADLDNEDFVGEVQYEKTASDIYACLSVVQTQLAPYANSGVTTADGATPEDIDAKYNELTDEEKANWNDSFAFAYILESIALSDGSTLYDLLMSDLDELVTEDLYALASVFSAAQAALIRTAGLKDVIIVSMLEENQWTSMYGNLVSLSAPISVYTGVDRSLFEGGVALTSKAMVEAAANADKQWFGGYMDNDIEEIFYRIITISFFAVIGAAALYLTSKAMFNWIGSSISSFVLTQDYCNAINFGGSWAGPYILSKMYMEAAQTIMLYVSQLMTYAFWIALGVLLVAWAIFLFAEGYAYYHPTYDEIPRILVEKIMDKNDETAYINYYSVKTLSGTIVDINQHDGSRWVALYTTKDSNAGTPVLADLKYSNKNLLNGYNGICRFSEDTPFNINKYSYNYLETIRHDSGSDNADYEEITSLYFFMVHADTTPSTYGSIFNSENIIIGIAGLVLGGLAGFGICKQRSKKKAIPAS